MKQAGAEVLRSLERMERFGEWDVVRAWLRASLADADQALRTSRGEEIGPWQGEARCLAEILKTADGAPARCRDLRAQETGYGRTAK